MRGIFTWTICPVGPNPIAQPHLNHAPRVPSTRHLFQFKQPLSLHSETLPRLLGLTKSQPIGRPAKSSSLIKFNSNPYFSLGRQKPVLSTKKKKITWDQKKTDKERNKSNKCERATSYCKTMELQNTVKEALNALYHHPDDGVRLQADRWLQDFQRTLDAWQVLCASLCVLVDLNVLFSFPEFLIDCWSFGEFGSRFGFGFLFSLRCDFSDYFGMFDHRDAIGFVSSLESLVHFIWMRWIQF